MRLGFSGIVAIIAVLGVAIVLALMNQLIPDGSAGHVPTYVLALAGKYLCFAMLALAVDLVWGFAGILSLGHAAFFALGGYAMGMSHAPNRHPGRLREPEPAGLHGVPGLEGAAVFLVRL
jgi:urea transport system permease protein